MRGVKDSRKGMGGGARDQLTFSLRAMPFRLLVGGAASSFGPLTLLLGISPLRTRLATLDWYSSRVMRVPKKMLRGEPRGSACGPATSRGRVEEKSTHSHEMNHGCE